MRWASIWLALVLTAVASAVENTIYTHPIRSQETRSDSLNDNTRNSETTTEIFNIICVGCSEEISSGNISYDATNEFVDIEHAVLTTPDPELEDGISTNGDDFGSTTLPTTDDGSEEIGNEDLIVETSSGPVQGFVWQGNENIISYIDIPYGNLTNLFQPATATVRWETTHSVRDHDKRCPQLEEDEYVGDTDCLTLSIFKPLNAESASVLFHIHAENFNTGSGDPSIYGPDYLAANGIILVLPNYRLGPLGFFCMQNDTAPGNMALKDLSSALSWIYDNIEAFGGNPDNIAVSGDGRSGALAGLLALYPKSKDYVNKVIAESGSFLSYWALDRDPINTASSLLENITELEGVQSRQDISLDNLDVKSVVTAARGIEFRPCLETNTDNAFMTATPYAILTNEKIETSFLLGSAMYAGVHEALDQTEDSITQLNEDLTLLLPNDLRFSTATLREQVAERVKTQYFGANTISIEDLQNISLCFTDSGYLSPGIRSARLLVEANATVYFYEFAFVGDLNRVLESVNHPVEGAVRGDIVGYLFSQGGVGPQEQQTEESRMVEMLTQMWTNFLKNGSPSTDTIEWNKLEIKDQLEEEWLLIDSEPSMQKGLHVNRLSLWTEIYEQHFVDVSHADGFTPSVTIVLILQLLFWTMFYRNVSRVF